jgi:lactoylglutathione lyase
MRLEHVGVWVRDLERMREFYVGALGGEAGPLYENPRTGFRSYFITFGEGARVELMSGPGVTTRAVGENRLGYAHLALGLGDAPQVDALVARLEASGVVVFGRPRTTGDGYYEAVVEDPEGNRIELVADPSGDQSRARQERPDGV